MVAQTALVAHPLDQFTIDEIKIAAGIIREHKSEISFAFNSITLHEPRKSELLEYFKDNKKKIDRKAFSIAFESGTTTLYEVIVNITTKKVEEFVLRKGVMPTITLEDLQATEEIVRADPRVIKLCADIGIDDMTKVYCDAWTIGFDERWGTKHRLQQALMYYRVTEHDNQYAHPLDFCPVVDTQTEKVVEIDIKVKKGSKFERAPVPQAQHNYMPEFVKTYRNDIKPLNIQQPEGVSFTMNGGEISWLGFKLHIGFNGREGIVLNNIRVEDPETGIERSMFHRLSIAEMVVPYGCPTKPHHRKHAFDVGEYGMGLMTNSLQLGCDCKGSIHYLDGIISNRAGEATVIKNAVCIHEEDAGILFKHTDFRDENVISTRGRKLVISQVFTAANYEYCIYWQIYQDGTIQIELKLTGMLNTVSFLPFSITQLELRTDMASTSSHRTRRPASGAQRSQTESSPTTTSTSSTSGSTQPSMDRTTPSSSLTPSLQRKKSVPRRITTETASTRKRLSTRRLPKPRPTTATRRVGRGTLSTPPCCTRTPRNRWHTRS